MECDFKFEESFKNRISNEVLGEHIEVPHIYIRPAEKVNNSFFNIRPDACFNLKQKYKRIEMRLSIEFSGSHGRVEIKNFDPAEFIAEKFENEVALKRSILATDTGDDKEYGLLIIEFKLIEPNLSTVLIGDTISIVSYLKAAISNTKRFALRERRKKDRGRAFARASTTKVVGTCVVSLSKAFDKNETPQEWPICNEHEKVGSICLVLSYKNQSCATRKEALSKLIMDKMCKEISILQEEALVHTSELDLSRVMDISNETKVPLLTETCAQENLSLNSEISHFEAVIKLLRVMYFVEASRAKVKTGISMWDGALEPRLTNIVTCFRQLYKEKQLQDLQVMVPCFLLELRSLFPEIASKVCHMHVNNIFGLSELSGEAPRNSISSSCSCCWGDSTQRVLYSATGRKGSPAELAGGLIELGSHNYTEDVYGSKSSSSMPASMEEYLKDCLCTLFSYHEIDALKKDDKKTKKEDVRYIDQECVSILELFPPLASPGNPNWVSNKV